MFLPRATPELRHPSIADPNAKSAPIIIEIVMTINRFSELAAIAVRAFQALRVCIIMPNVAAHKSCGREFHVIGRRAYT
jgi:hypothetical protein